MFCRRLNLSAIQLLLRCGQDMSLLDEQGRNGLWYASLPNRRRRWDNNVLVRRVRGEQEAAVRGQVVELLLGAGVRPSQEVLDQLGVSLPGSR